MIIVPNRSIIRPPREIIPPPRPFDEALYKKYAMTPLIRAGAARSGIALPEPPPSDPFFANVVALLHMEGANNGSVFTDVKGKTWTRTGTNVFTDTGQFKFGASSARFNNTTNRVDTADHADFNFGSGDWTVECWIRFTAFSSVQLISQYNASSGRRSWLLGVSSTGITCTTSSDGSSFYPTASLSWSPSLNVWYHVGMSRVGASSYAFGNGAISAAANIGAGNALHDSNANVTLGNSASAGGAAFNGHLDEVRITKGVGRYSSSYTVPDAPWPDQ